MRTTHQLYLKLKGLAHINQVTFLTDSDIFFQLGFGTDWLTHAPPGDMTQKFLSLIVDTVG